MFKRSPVANLLTFLIPEKFQSLLKQLQIMLDQVWSMHQVSGRRINFITVIR